MAQFNKKDILRLFHLLNDQMRAHSLEGEVYLVGGAVMCLVLRTRESTKDVDGWFSDPRAVRDAARRVAQERHPGAGARQELSRTTRGTARRRSAPLTRLARFSYSDPRVRGRIEERR